MKRFLSLTLCLILMLSFVGCGKNKEEITTTTTSPATYYSEDINGGYVTEYYSEVLYSNVNLDNGNQVVNQNQSNIAQNSGAGSNSVTNSDSASVGNSNSGTLNNSQSDKQPTTTVKVNNNTQTNNNSQNSNTQTTASRQTTVASSTALVPTIESLSGVQKATYNTAERTYIIYYPTDLLNKNVTFPVLSWANGTMCQPSLYDALLQKLALGGFIVIATDETMAADGTAQIAAIDFVIEENSNAVSALFKKVNTSKIGVIGHSQGGRSAVNAAAMDSRITCVISIAGSNYVEEAQKLSKPVLFFAGAKDKVVDANTWIITAYNAVGGPAVYASLNGAIHTTCCSKPDAYSNYAINWFNAWFYNNADAKAMFKEGGTFSTDSNWSGYMSKGF